MNVCAACENQFKNPRGLKSHIMQREFCLDYYKTLFRIKLKQDVDHTNDTLPPMLVDDNGNDLYVLQDILDDEYPEEDDDVNMPIVTVEDEVLSDLLALIHKLGCPLYSFKLILDWASKAQSMGYVFKGDNRDRRTVMACLTKLSELQSMKHTNNHVQLEGQQQPTSVITYPFVEAVKSLLDDKELTKMENLVLNPDDILACYESKNENIDEIHDGLWYKNTYDQTINDPDTQFLCPIVFYVDKCHIDNKGNFSLEPVLITSTIFDRKTRNLPSAWRYIGMIKDIKNKKNSPKGQSVRNFHAQLTTILGDLIQTQQNGGFHHYLKLGNLNKHILVKTPIAFVIGDCLSNDSMCGRYGGFTLMYRICRTCNCSWWNSDDPTIKCNWLFSAPMKALFDKQKTDELKLLFQHNMDLAFFHTDFGANSHGIFGATPVDMLHTFRLGIVKYIITIFYKNSHPSNLTQLTK